MWGENRADALRHMASALADYQVAGLPNNLGFLSRAVAHPDFAAGGVDTSFLNHHLQECLPVPTPAPAPAVALAALAVTARFASSSGSGSDVTSPWRASEGSRPGLPGSASIELAFTDPDAPAPPKPAAASAAAAAAPAKGKKAAAGPDPNAHVRAVVHPTLPALPTAAGGSAKAAPGARAFKLTVGGSTHDVSGVVTDITASVPARSTVPGFEAATTGKTVAGVQAFSVSATLDGSSSAKATVVTVAEADGLDVYIYPQGTLPGTDPLTSLGRTYRLGLPSQRFGKAGAGSSAGHVKTPMPGKVIKVRTRQELLTTRS